MPIQAVKECELRCFEEHLAYITEGLVEIQDATWAGRYGHTLAAIDDVIKSLQTLRSRIAPNNMP